MDEKVIKELEDAFLESYNDGFALGSIVTSAMINLYLFNVYLESGLSKEDADNLLIEFSNDYMKFCEKNPEAISKIMEDAKQRLLDKIHAETALSNIYQSPIKA